MQDNNAPQNNPDTTPPVEPPTPTAEPTPAVEPMTPTTESTPPTAPEAVPAAATPAATQAPAETTTPPPAPAPKKGASKAVKIIVGVIVGVVVLIGLGIAALLLIVNMAAQAPLDVSNKFFDNLQANQSSSACELTSTAFKNSTSEAQLDSLFTQLSPLVTGEEKVTAKKVQSSNGLNQAAIVYSVENGGETRYARVVLQETDSKWEVINFRTSTTALEAIVE